MRLFVAVDIPEQHKQSIEIAIQAVRIDLSEARWIPRNNWHATVKFLGEVPDERVPEIEAVLSASLAGFLPIDSQLTSLGAFPSSRRARVLWVGLSDEAGSLAGLASHLDKEFGARGFRQDSRELHPHVTVARIRIPMSVSHLLDRAYELDRSPFPISQAVLYRSSLRRTGSEYQPLASFPAKDILPSP